MTLDKKTKLLIESQYWGSCHYFARVLLHKQVIIEQYEHWEKSSYRNRCYILMPAGPLRLSIPINKGKQQRKAVKDIKISYEHAWQKLHWSSICTAYRSSPYFEYYEDDLYPFYHKRYDYLLDYNQQLMQAIIDLLQLDVKVSYTEKFKKNYADVPEILDFRSVISPRKNKPIIDTRFTPPKYHQVFENKIDFAPNLSILDLLFAEGPQSVNFLQSAMEID